MSEKRKGSGMTKSHDDFIREMSAISPGIEVLGQFEHTSKLDSDGNCC